MLALAPNIKIYSITHLYKTTLLYLFYIKYTSCFIELLHHVQKILILYYLKEKSSENTRVNVKIILTENANFLTQKSHFLGILCALVAV